ncbi:E3 ubiquitin-protein ligase RMND5A-like isoform X2 [Watersipora subatra]|uniref:E3 ubiquitin-protein ligase RMND5A-like isoform X2 n=1 Tax=Watersipora subatra TaxID=2589382 RepID=UPI00355C668A
MSSPRSINRFKLLTRDDRLTDVQKSIVRDCMKKVQETSKSVSSQHKDLHGSVSKIGKAIDKNFVSDFSPVPKCLGEDKISLLNEVICEHFLRQGRLNIAEALIEESKLELTEKAKLPFLEMHEIVEGLKAQNLVPALTWAERNHEILSKQNSSIEFNLHRMNFLMLLNSKSEHSRWDAVQYAKIFQIFSPRHAKDIQQLMGCFLFQDRGIEHSPYAHLLSLTAWQELEEQFAKDACMLLGHAMESPLMIAINAGTKTLGPLMHITNVMLQKQLPPEWGPKAELPVSVDLGQDSLFHSVFACPILRQHVAESNPPMKLTCGHVVSKDALNQLFNGQKVKCPYCPAEQNITNALRLHV